MIKKFMFDLLVVDVCGDQRKAEELILEIDVDQYLCRDKSPKECISKFIMSYCNNDNKILSFYNDYNCVVNINTDNICSFNIYNVKEIK